jgi:hypoxanthine phosphoribosyltransferase
MNEIVSKKNLASIVKKLAKQITNDYTDTDELIVIGLLKGSFIFVADLIRQLELPVKVDFMSVSSYENNTQGSDVKINLDISIPITGKDVLIVEDIIDTGKTFAKVLELLKQRHPKSLKTCVLLNKKECRIVDSPVDYCGMEIPNIYVFGYGLDDDQLMRGLTFIANK